MIEPFVPLLVVGAAVVTVVIGVLGDAQRKLKKKLKQAPHRDIKHLPEREFVRFVGKVLAEEALLEAPLSGRACLAWRVRITEKRGKSHHVVLARDATRDFRIRDATGTLHVRADGAELALVEDSHFRSGVMHDPTPRLARFLAEQGEKSTGWFFNRTLNYSEAVIEPGEMVAVAGFARAEPDPDPDPTRARSGYRETPMRMVLRSSIHDKVIVSDDPRLAVTPRR